MQGWELCSHYISLIEMGLPLHAYAFSIICIMEKKFPKLYLHDVLSCLISEAKVDQLDDLGSFHCSSQ